MNTSPQNLRARRRAILRHGSILALALAALAMLAPAADLPLLAAEQQVESEVSPLSLPVPLPFGIGIPGYANAVSVSGNCASVAAGFRDLVTIDFSVASPILTQRSFAGFAFDVVVRGDLAFMAAGAAGLLIVDVSDCRSPSLVGSLAMPGSPTDAQSVAVAGNLAALADRFGGVWWIDISDPSNPVLKNPGFTQIKNGALGVALSQDGSFAAVANQQEKMVRTVDLPTPWSPQLRGQFETGDPRDVRIVEGVHPDGPIVVVADFQNSMTFLGISDLANPTLLAQTAVTDGVRLFDLEVFGTCAFGADTALGVVPVIDFSSMNPLTLLPPIDPPQPFVTGIAVQGDVVYVTTSVTEAAKGVFGQTALFVQSYPTSSC